MIYTVHSSTQLSKLDCEVSSEHFIDVGFNGAEANCEVTDKVTIERHHNVRICIYVFGERHCRFACSLVPPFGVETFLIVTKLRAKLALNGFAAISLDLKASEPFMETSYVRLLVCFGALKFFFCTSYYRKTPCISKLIPGIKNEAISANGIAKSFTEFFLKKSF